MTTFTDKTKWNPLRSFLLLFLLGCSLAVLAKVLFFPVKQKKSLDETFIFPKSIPLAKWQAEKSYQVDKQPNRHIYQYHQGSEKLTIDAVSKYRFDGGVLRQLMLNYNARSGQVPMMEKYIPQKGYVVFFKKDKKLYLSSCLNPAGESTITDQQFVKNRYRHGLSLERTFFWMLGEKDIFDGRCLWTTISTPLPANADEKALAQNIAKLEKVWLDWGTFWNGRW